MLLTISCPSCGHVGLINAETLPRDLVCSRCGSSRYVKAAEGAQITSTAKREEQVAAILAAAR
jgi:hypothetical protein